MSSSHCSSSITNWSLVNDGSGDYTGTSASTTFICFNSASVFYTNSPKFGYFNPNTDYIFDISPVLSGEISEIANTVDKVWVYTGGTDLVEFDLEMSPILFNGLGADFPATTFNRLLTSSGVTAFEGLGALDSTRLVGGSGSTIYLHTIIGSGFTSELLFTLPESRTINDISYNSLKNTFVVACMKSDETINYISEFTTGGTLVNDFSFDNTTYAEILSAVEYSGKTYFMGWDNSVSTTYEVEVDVFNTGFTTGYDFSNPSISGFSQSPGSITSFFNYSAASYCLSTNYITTSQYDGNYTSGGTFNGKTFYAGNGASGGVIYYNTGSTSWCLSTYLGGPCILFGGSSCQSEIPNLYEGFFNNSICPTPTPSPTNNCSVLDVQAYFDCDIPMPTPSVTPTMTVTPTSGYTYPTPTPTMTMSPTPSGNICGNVNFCFTVQNVSPTPSPTPTMTPSSAAGRNTYGGVVTFTTINGEVVCPPSQLG
jgi:hypothetical protein